MSTKLSPPQPRRSQPGGNSSLARRSKILFAFREIVVERASELAAIVTAEHGKVLSDALGEVNRAIEVMEFACGIPHLLKGGYSEEVSTQVDVYSIRQPLGVVGIISPFNFPAMVPSWFFPIAIACGNTVVLKPSEKDPSASVWFAERWAEAGLPEGVFNVVHGDKVAVDRMLDHPDVQAVSFVGSTPIARYVYENGTRAGKRVQALGGAKNHMVVLPDADLDLAADAAVNAGFGSAGERCMAISAVVAVEPVADELISKICERMATLKVGDGRRDVDMGPLVTSAHRDKVAGYLEAGVEAGAELVVDGRAHRGGRRVGRLLARADAVRQGHARDVDLHRRDLRPGALGRAGAHLRRRPRARQQPTHTATARPSSPTTAAPPAVSSTRSKSAWSASTCPIPVPVAYYSFGGWKASLFGDSHAHGTEGVHFYTRGKVVTSRWLDPSHGGINLGFPQTS